MYKFSRNSQITFSDFNQPLGMKMNANNRWVKKAEMIPWDKIEEKYSKLFPSKTGKPAKPRLCEKDSVKTINCRKMTLW